MPVLAFFVFSALLSVVTGRASELFFYVPVACFGLLPVWIAATQNGVRQELTDENAEPRPSRHWR